MGCELARRTAVENASKGAMLQQRHAAYVGKVLIEGAQRPLGRLPFSATPGCVTKCDRGVSVRQEDGSRRRIHKRAGHAAEEDLGKARAAVSAHHDHVRIEIGDRRQQCFMR